MSENADGRQPEEGAKVSWPPGPFSGTCSLPMVDASQVQVGVMLLRRVTGGYEGTVYALPPGASGMIPLAEMEPGRRGLYDESGTLIREL